MAYTLIAIQFDVLFEGQCACSGLLGQLPHAVNVRLREMKGKNVASNIFREIAAGWIEEAPPKGCLA